MADRVDAGQAGSTQSAVAAVETGAFPYDARAAANGGVGNLARGFVVLDATAGQTVEFVDSEGNTEAIDVTNTVGVFFPIKVDTFTANTDVDSLLVLF